MSYSMRLFVVVLSFLLAPPAGADDKPSPKPADARRDALVRAGYTAVPMALDPQVLCISINGAIGNEKTRFFLNSGSSETVLDLKLANRLKFQESGGRTYIPGLILGAYDTRKDWPHLPIEPDSLDGWPGSPGGVLGTVVLDSWAAIVDYSTRSIYFRPPLTTAWPRLAGTWTVTSWQEDGAARKLDPKSPPSFNFADRRLKLTDGDTTREYALRFGPDVGGDILLLINPKSDADPFPKGVVGGGRIKLKNGVMTACLGLKTDKTRPIPTAFAASKGSGYVLLELKRTDPKNRKPQSDPLRELLLKDGYTAVPMEREKDGTRIAAARIGQHHLRMLVSTGATTSALDAAGSRKWGAIRLGTKEIEGLGVNSEVFRLRGMSLGGYDTRRSWAVVNGCELDLANVNRNFSEHNIKPIEGVLGNYDLLNGSAVIDYGTNTLYLRPIKIFVEPQLEGKWVGVAWEFDGNKGKYAPGDAAVEFKNGRIRFATKDGAAESEFHLRDMGDRFALGLFDPKADVLADGFSYTSTGAIRLTDGKMTLVMQKGQLRKEPIGFAASKGSGLLLVEYERAK